MEAILKGGGYGGHHILGGAGVRLRHHYWTGTTDDVPKPMAFPLSMEGLNLLRARRSASFAG